MNNWTILKTCFMLCACLGITQAYGQVTIYGQDFEGTYPWGMTNTALNGTSHLWDDGDDLGLTNEAGGTGNFAVANSDYWCDDPWDASLATPALDFSGYMNVSLTFNSYFQDFIDAGEIWVDVSTNGGTTWTTEFTETFDMVVAPITVDLSDYDGAASVLVRWRYSDNDDGCAWYWYIDDIEITGDPSGACAAPLTGGTATASGASVCPSVNFSISVAGGSIGSGITYQWQSSPDGLVWTNVGGQTGSSFGGSQTTALAYRRRLICSAGPDTAYSTTANVGINSFINCYCTPDFTNDIEPITLVQLSTINNATSGTVNGTPALEDFSAMTADLVKGVTYNITVNGNTAGDYINHMSAYADWNQNGLLTDPGEEFQLGSIENCANCGVTSTITVPSGALTGQTRLRIVKKFDVIGGPCNTDGFGQVEDYTLNILPPPTDEAGVVAITRPEVAACTLGNQIWVQLQNLGSNDLTSLTFAVHVNGILVGSPAWTGTVAAGTSAEIQVPITYTLANGDSVSVSVSGPNGQVEDPLFLFNNQEGRIVQSALSGIKTIDAAGSGANNYLTMDDALDALVEFGVCDTVYFHIASGTYTTQHVFGEYLAAGPGKLAVFESATGVATDVTYARNGTSAADNYVFQFDGGDYYMIRNITVKNQGTAYATSVDIRNGANDLTFEGNIFYGDTAGTNVVGDFDRIVIASVQGTNDFRTVLRNNEIIGGTRAIIIAGAGGSFEDGHVFEGNNIIENTAMGLLVGNVTYPVIRNNTFRNRANVTGEAYGMILNVNIDGALIDANSFEQYRTGTSIYLINAKGGALPFQVSNNFVYHGDTTNTGSSAILVEDVNSSDIRIANNSISYQADNGGAIILTDGSGIDVVNNNIGAFGNAPALRVVKPYSLNQSNNNNLFAGTSTVFYTGQNHATLAAWQAASSFDAASVSVNPGFTGTDLHTCAPGLNGAAQSLSGLLADFDGNTRSATPDIGADEFVGDANGLLSGDDFLKCPAVSVTLGNAPIEGVTYAWTPSGSTSEISVTAAGTYIVTATSACGSFSDTAVVANKPLPNANFTASQVGLAAIFNNTSTNGTSYSWDFGDGNSSTETSPSHVYSTGGTYSATLTVTNECGSDTHGPIPVNVFAAGINEAAGNLEVFLFPNPTDGQFTVSMSGLANEATVLSVIDVTGKVVMTHNVPAGTYQVTLDATTFASGVYSVKISNGEFNKVIRLVRK